MLFIIHYSYYKCIILISNLNAGNKFSNSSENKESLRTYIPDAENFSNSDLNTTTLSPSDISIPNQPKSSILNPLRNLIAFLLKLPANKSKNHSSSTSSGNASATESQWSFPGKPLTNGSTANVSSFFRIIRQVKVYTKNCSESSGNCDMVDQTKSYMKDYLNVNEAQYMTLFGFIALGMCMGLLLAKFLGDEE